MTSCHDFPVDELVPPDDRESAYVLFQRGQALIRDRHYAQAATVLERADRAEPGKGSILEALGRAHFNARHYGVAREVFERLAAVDPSSAYGHYAVSQCLLRLGHRHEAATHARLAAALEPASSLYRGAARRMPLPIRRPDPGEPDQR